MVSRDRGGGRGGAGIGYTSAFCIEASAQVNFVSQTTPAVRTFQDLILALQNYWAEQGCVVLQPHDMEVGAGTFHTATFLRAIGPETWNAAYVQPSRRPTDGRYGENPNRLQHYYQFQVVLKPNPENFQELYLGSLKAIGIDPLVHDIPLRRGQLGVADPRRLGPGLGNLAERHGSHPVHLLPAGRRHRVLSGHRRDHRPGAPGHVPAGRGLGLRPGLTGRPVRQGHLWRRVPPERGGVTTFNFEHANVPKLFELFDFYESEANRLIALELPLPTHEMVLK